MNPNYSEFKFPQIRPTPLHELFKNSKHQRDNKEAINLIQKILVYNPDQRLKPLQALQHPFFDELREQGKKLPNGMALPDLFDFTDLAPALPVEGLLPALP